LAVAQGRVTDGLDRRKVNGPSIVNPVPSNPFPKDHDPQITRTREIFIEKSIMLGLSDEIPPHPVTVQLGGTLVASKEEPWDGDWRPNGRRKPLFVACGGIVPVQSVITSGQ